MPSTLVEQAAPYKIKLLENNLGELENKGWLSQTTFYIFVHARKRLKSIDSFKVTTRTIYMANTEENNSFEVDFEEIIEDPQAHNKKDAYY